MSGGGWRDRGEGGRGTGGVVAFAGCLWWMVLCVFVFRLGGLGVYFGVGWRGEGMSGWEGLRGGEKMSG